MVDKGVDNGQYHYRAEEDIEALDPAQSIGDAAAYGPKHGAGEDTERSEVTGDHFDVGFVEILQPELAHVDLVGVHQIDFHIVGKSHEAAETNGIKEAKPPGIFVF